MGGIQMEMCIQCKEKWFEMKLDRRGLQEAGCSSETEGNATSMLHVYGEGNVMDPGEMPDGLRPLTPVEEMLIAQARVQGGHTVTFLQV
jgi:uncharacterized protein DUF6570